jgi:hypothetical protein
VVFEGRQSIKVPWCGGTLSFEIHTMGERALITCFIFPYLAGLKLVNLASKSRGPADKDRQIYNQCPKIYDLQIHKAEKDDIYNLKVVQMRIFTEQEEW